MFLAVDAYASSRQSVSATARKWTRLAGDGPNNLNGRDRIGKRRQRAYFPAPKSSIDLRPVAGKSVKKPSTPSASACFSASCADCGG